MILVHSRTTKTSAWNHIFSYRYIEAKKLYIFIYTYAYAYNYKYTLIIVATWSILCVCHCMSVCIYIYIYLSIYLSIGLSIYLSIYLYIYLCVRYSCLVDLSFPGNADASPKGDPAAVCQLFGPGGGATWQTLRGLAVGQRGDLRIGGLEMFGSGSCEDLWNSLQNWCECEISGDFARDC